MVLFLSVLMTNCKNVNNEPVPSRTNQNIQKRDVSLVNKLINDNDFVACNANMMNVYKLVSNRVFTMTKQEATTWLQEKNNLPSDASLETRLALYPISKVDYIKQMDEAYTNFEKVLVKYPELKNLSSSEYKDTMNGAFDILNQEEAQQILTRGGCWGQFLADVRNLIADVRDLIRAGQPKERIAEFALVLFENAVGNLLNCKD